MHVCVCVCVQMGMFVCMYVAGNDVDLRMSRGDWVMGGHSPTVCLCIFCLFVCSLCVCVCASRLVRIISFVQCYDSINPVLRFVLDSMSHSLFG